MMTANEVGYTTSTRTVLVLLFCLLGLIILLVFLYKKLNKDAHGKYTVRRIVFREGGLRDRVRGAAQALGTRLGVQLWPSSETDEDGEEMQDIQDEEGQVEQGSSQESDSEGGDQEEECNEEEGGRSKGKEDDTTDDDSCSEGSEAEERPKPADRPEAKGAMGEKGDGKEEKVGEDKGKCEASGGTGLLIDLKQFSGSAIWSEEEGARGKDGEVTLL